MQSVMLNRPITYKCKCDIIIQTYAGKVRFFIQVPPLPPQQRCRHRVSVQPTLQRKP